MVLGCGGFQPVGLGFFRHRGGKRISLLMCLKPGYLRLKLTSHLFQRLQAGFVFVVNPDDVIPVLGLYNSADLANWGRKRSLLEFRHHRTVTEPSQEASLLGASWVHSITPVFGILTG